jgi:hypothetical protein
VEMYFRANLTRRIVFLGKCVSREMCFRRNGMRKNDPSGNVIRGNGLQMQIRGVVRFPITERRMSITYRTLAFPPESREFTF